MYVSLLQDSLVEQ